MGRTPLQSAAESLFADIAAEKSPKDLLLHFSTTHAVTIQHDYANAPSPTPFSGHHAVRSYFDLLAMHWKRDEMKYYNCTMDADENKVIMNGRVRWTWRTSKRSWREVFRCTLEFDDNIKVKSFTIETLPDPAEPMCTCVMHAVDTAISARTGPDASHTKYVRLPDQ